MATKRINLIGAGSIARPVIDYLKSGGYWELGSILVRTGRGPKLMTDADAFFASKADLVVEAAGPDALRLYGERALSLADVWTISGSVLGDHELYGRIEAAGLRSGHRLRVLSGSIGGLDAVSAGATDPGVVLRVSATRPSSNESTGEFFTGTLEDATKAFPHDTNFAAAAGLAGPGFSMTNVTLNNSGPSGEHVLSLSTRSHVGRFSASLRVETSSPERVHPVAASIIAALQKETRTIWAG